MLSKEQAISIVSKIFPSGEIQKVADYKGKYIFMIFTNDPYEGHFDPFYSVDKETGKFSDYSLFEDGDPNKIVKLFEDF